MPSRKAPKATEPLSITLMVKSMVLVAGENLLPVAKIELCLQLRSLCGFAHWVEYRKA